MLTSSRTGSLGNGRELISAQRSLLHDSTQSRGSGASPGTKRSGRGCEPWTFTIISARLFGSRTQSKGACARHRGEVLWLRSPGGYAMHKHLARKEKAV